MISNTHIVTTDWTTHTFEVKTYYDPPPIPLRQYDWAAIDYGRDMGEQFVGHGINEKAAIDDLMEQLCDRHDA